MTRRMLPLIVLIFAASALALADEAAIQGIGGAIRPMREHPSVAMERMEVNADIWPRYARVDCRFVLRNTGPAITVRMGFPEQSELWVRHAFVGFTRFATWVDGRHRRTRVEGTTLEPGDDLNGWQRWRVTRVGFGPHQTRRVRVRYEAPLSEELMGGRVFRYVISTGASWKGPIGFARVRIRGHFDPSRGWLDVDPPLERVGGLTWEWTQRQFKPSDSESDDLEAEYYPGYVGVSIEGEGCIQDPGDPPYPYLRRGIAWVSAPTLAAWLGVDLAPRRSRATFLRGGRRVEVRTGKPFLGVNGKHLSVPVAPHSVGGKLMVPLAAVARALGGQVSFDHKTRVTDIRFADQEYIRTALNRKEAPETSYQYLPDAFAPPEMSSYDPDVLSLWRSEAQGRPWLCVGDFDGDGIRDAAMLLQEGNKIGLGVLSGIPNMSFPFDWVEKWRIEDARRPGGLGVYVRTHAPGVVECLPERGRGERTEGMRLELKHDAIQVTFAESATLLHYWDDAQKCYRKVWLAD